MDKHSYVIFTVLSFGTKLTQHETEVLRSSYIFHSHQEGKKSQLPIYKPTNHQLFQTLVPRCLSVLKYTKNGHELVNTIGCVVLHIQNLKLLSYSLIFSISYSDFLPKFSFHFIKKYLNVPCEDENLATEILNEKKAHIQTYWQLLEGGFTAGS